LPRPMQETGDDPSNERIYRKFIADASANMRPHGRTFLSQIFADRVKKLTDARPRCTAAVASGSMYAKSR
jgi:hypothetical protein